MRRILLAAAGAASICAPAMAQPYYGNGDSRYEQDRQTYEQQRQDYERRREDYERNRRDYDANREQYRENYDQYRREYRRWERGQYLPREYWNRWGTISDWSDYQLRRPRYGYEWVFDGENYLLISRRNGYVAEVVRPGDRDYVPYPRRW